MCTTILALVLLAQDGTSLPGSSMFNTLEAANRAADVEKAKRALEKAGDREAAAKEQEFVERFNALIQALSEVSKTYRTKHAIDVKSVESVKKAYRGLERADPWFRVEE